MTVTIHHGDCREVLAELPADSVEACVTDPPYGLGFMGKGWDATGIANKVETWAAVYCVLKPGAHLAAFGGTRTFHRMMCAIEDAGFEIRDTLMWVYGSGFPKSLNLAGGFGTALKPSFEPIVLARKPLAGTVAGTVAKHGTGALNIDGCRVEIDEEERGRIDTRSGAGQSADGWGHVGNRDQGERYKSDSAGRWPANVCHDGSPEVLAAFAAFGERRTAGNVNPTNQPLGFNGAPGRDALPINYADTGTAARFFYTAKASREEREIGHQGLPCSERAATWGDMGPVEGNPRKPATGHVQRIGNHHPTVKPLSLMQWLCRLVTPPGGTVLDPFAGSGSTLVAADREGFHGIGIEMDAEYLEIARRRFTGDCPLFADLVA